MSMETILIGALDPLVAGRVFPDVGPENVERPYITYQQVGGEPVNFLGGEVPSKSNARVQINVWGVSRQSVKEVARQAEAVLRATSGLSATVLTTGMGVYEPDTKLYGSMQDFSFWTE